MARKKKATKRRTSNKPIGFIKKGKSYKLVFGTKTKPRLGKSSYRTKAGMMKKAKTLMKK